MPEIKRSPSGPVIGREVTFTLTWGAIADEAVDVQSATVAGVLPTDVVVVNPEAAVIAGAAIAFVRVSAANTIDVAMGSCVVAGVTPGAIIFRGLVFSLS